MGHVRLVWNFYLRRTREKYTKKQVPGESKKMGKKTIKVSPISKHIVELLMFLL